MARAVVAFLLLSGLAHGNIARVRWRGVEAQAGTPPPRMESATAAHLALALRPLGAALVPTPPFDAEAIARCSFTVAKKAQCQVEVLAGKLHAERRGEIPFRDADDLAGSIALLVSGMLQTDFAELPQQIEPEPDPPRSPPKPLPNLVLPPDATPPPGAPPTAVQKAPSRGQLLLSVGPSVAVGVTGDPTLWGASLRALYLARRVLRAGGSLSLQGTDVSRGGYQLGFFRLLAAPRIGVGLTQGRIDVDLSVGPGLHLLHGQSSGVSHTLISAALVAGVRFGVLVGAGMALEAGLDVVGSLRDERVVAGPSEVTRFGHWWLDVSLAVVYRR